jgi:hypothetical protein
MSVLITASPSQLARVARLMGKYREPDWVINRGSSASGYLWTGCPSGMTEMVDAVLVEAGLLDPDRAIDQRG